MQQHERLKRARIEAGYKSGTEAASALNVAVATYNAHENGHRGLTVRSAELYADKFDVRAAWLLTGEEPMRYAKDLDELDAWVEEKRKDREGLEYGTFIPGRVYFAASPATLPEIANWPKERDGEAYDVVGEWTFPSDFIVHDLRSTTRSLFLLKAADDTMFPEVKAGDRVIVDSSLTSLRGDGHYAIADGDGQVHIRWLNKVVVNPSPDGSIGVGTMKPPEAYFTSPDKLSIVGKVVGKIGRL